MAREGDLKQAADLAGQVDDAMMRRHGPSHPTTLEAREIRAHVMMLAGELGAAITLYRDAAERWALGGDQAHAVVTADRAHALWLRIDDVDQAREIGAAVVRMRGQVPGDGARGYQAAQDHLARLEERARTRTTPQ